MRPHCLEQQNVTWQNSNTCNILPPRQNSPAPAVITPRSSPYSSRLSGEVAAWNCSCLPSRAYPDMNIFTQLGLVVQDISSFELYSTATFLPRLKETARYLSQSLLSNTHTFFSEQNLRRRIIELSKISCQWKSLIILHGCRTCNKRQAQK